MKPGYGKGSARAPKKNVPFFYLIYLWYNRIGEIFVTIWIACWERKRSGRVSGVPFFLGGVFGNLHQWDSGGYKYIYIYRYRYKLYTYIFSRSDYPLGIFSGVNFSFWGFWLSVEDDSSSFVCSVGVVSCKWSAEQWPKPRLVGVYII